MKHAQDYVDGAKGEENGLGTSAQVASYRAEICSSQSDRCIRVMQGSQRRSSLVNVGKANFAKNELCMPRIPFTHA